MLSRASRAADPLGLGRQVRELIPITRVECTEYAAAIFILHQPKLGVEVASILLACQDALEAWQDRPVIEHEILLPIERLVLFAKRSFWGLKARLQAHLSISSPWTLHMFASIGFVTVCIK